MSGDGAYYGAPGSYSEEAARQAFGEQATLIPCERVTDVFDAVVSGRAARGVAPVENSLAGSVLPTYDALLEHPVFIVGEVIQPIHHLLIGARGASLDRIRRVVSHPVALAQCRRFLAAHPLVEAVAVGDTASAVQQAVAQDSGETAAIGSRRAAARYGGVVLSDEVQDHPRNFTRFVTLASSPATVVDEGASCKTTIAFRVPHRPGSLFEALRVFAERALNLLTIEKRTVPQHPFEYVFVVDVEGRTGTPAIDEACAALARASSWLRVIGSYTAARET